VPQLRTLLTGLAGRSFIWLALAVASLVWVLLSQVRVIPGRGEFLGADGALSFLENKTLDARFRLRGEIPSPIRIHYVNVDTFALSEFGNWPWNRGLFALALDALFTHGEIQAAGLDFVFSKEGFPNLGREEALAGSRELGKTIHAHENIVLAAAYNAATDLLTREPIPFPFVFSPHAGASTHLPELPAPSVAGFRGKIGLIDVTGDDRFIPFFATAGTATYYPLSLRLALLHWGLDAGAISLAPHALTVRRPDGSLVARTPLLLGQLAEINWFSPWESSQDSHVSIAEVIGYGELAKSADPAEREEARQFFAPFRQAIVLIGPTDPLLRDISPAPLDRAAVPRVAIHGNTLKSLLSGRYLQRPPAWLNALLIAAAGFLTAALCLQEKNASWKKCAALAFLPGWLAVAFLVFRWDLILPVTPVLGNVLTCAFLATLWQLRLEQQHRNFITGLFGSYVSPKVVEQMVNRRIAPELGGTEVGITALFTDIEAFSLLAETLSPRELVELMNEYLGACTTALTRQEGTLDKYVGDAIIAMFGAPLPCADDAAAACRAALDILAAQNALVERWRAEARWPERALALRTRIGLNTGRAVVGNLGSAQRFNYTMMGDDVNLAQRMESACGIYGVNILVSATTREAAAASDASLCFRRLDRVLVPGRLQPVEIHQLLGRFDLLTEQTLRCTDLYEKGLAAYFRSDWTAARAFFEQSLPLEHAPTGANPSRLLLQRCDLFLREGPPPGWNFAFKLQKGS
jgi:adenylate cyclase